jgi:hypothetical protein
VLTGIHPRFSKTMQLLVMANDVQLRALLDSGNTHNFVDSTTAKHAGIALWGCAGLHVIVANGDRLPSSGCCKGLCLDIAGESFHVDCYGLALVSFDMVLGV